MLKKLFIKIYYNESCMKKSLLVLVLLSIQLSFAMYSSEQKSDSTQNSNWNLPHNQIVPVLYYQGMTESQTQCAKYTGDHGFMSTTGEHVVCSKSIDVMLTPYIGVEIDEVQPQVPFSTLWQNRMNPLNLVKASYYYAHYLANQKRNKLNSITVSSTQSQSPGQTIAGHSVNVSQINIGQDGDVKNHKNKYDKLTAEHGDCPVIIYGVSRGAATSFSALALNKYPNVRLAILEGCFDSHSHLIKERWPKLFSIGAQNVLVPLIERVTSYKRNGINPIDNVPTFPKQVTTLFITSKIDAEVPADCTRELAHALAQNGQKEVYLLELENSRHPRYMMDDPNDTKTYEQVTHALYQKLQLPHKPALAEKGKQTLTKCLLQSPEEK